MVGVEGCWMGGSAKSSCEPEVDAEDDDKMNLVTGRRVCHRHLPLWTSESGCKSFRVSLKCAEDLGLPHVFRDLQLACLVLSHRRRWLIFLANGRKMDAHTMS